MQPNRDDKTRNWRMSHFQIRVPRRVDDQPDWGSLCWWNAFSSLASRTRPTSRRRPRAEQTGIMALAIRLGQRSCTARETPMAAGPRNFAWTTYLALLCAASSFGQSQTGLPPIKTADYDQRGTFRVNGKPFFPIALYDAPLDDRTLRELRDFGFNVLACDAKSCASLPAKGFYGASHADKKIDDLNG